MPAPSKEQSKGTPLKLVFLHSAITWPGISGSETTLSDLKIKGVKMYDYEHWMELELKGQKCRIYHANIKNSVIDEDAIAKGQ